MSSLAPFDKSRYLSGYSVGVGGVVRFGDRVLLVRLALGSHAGSWAIPGGFVEPGEMLDAAILRELGEETGVSASIQGIIGVRGRLTPGENSAYFIFLLDATSDATQPDQFEVDAARYFTLDEALALPGLNALSRIVVERVLTGQARVLAFVAHPEFPASEYGLYL